ncbi:MAG: VWA domain-containing protein [Verrucomicrobiales bacterium]|nr:VWA domain-containing protein [Verrucomicrobiales bacterium]
MEQLPFIDVEFVDNPEPRCPCVLLLDVSYSMQGAPIDALNEAIQQFKDELLQDRLASKRVEVAVVTFGENVRPVHEFVTPDNFFPEEFVVNGATPMAEAVVKGNQLLDARKAQYREAGISYFRPWMFLITDGIPTDINTHYWEEAKTVVRNGEENKHLLFFGVAVTDADQRVLDELCPLNRPSLKMRGLSFRELFSWLSASLRTVSSNTPGGQTSLPPTDSWTSIDI